MTVAVRRRLPPPISHRLGGRQAPTPGVDAAARPGSEGPPPSPASSWQDAARSLQPGEGRDFPVPQGKTPRRFAQALGVLAARAWGNGTYSIATGEGAVRLSRKCAGDASDAFGNALSPSPQPPPPAPAAVAPGGMCRERAAAWLAPYFPRGMTAVQLKGLDARGAGPRRFLAGRAVVYYAADLEAWLRTRFRSVGGGGGGEIA